MNLRGSSGDLLNLLHFRVLAINALSFYMTKIYAQLKYLNLCRLQIMCMLTMD